MNDELTLAQAVSRALLRIILRRSMRFLTLTNLIHLGISLRAEPVEDNLKMLVIIVHLWHWPLAIKARSFELGDQALGNTFPKIEIRGMRLMRFLSLFQVVWHRE